LWLSNYDCLLSIFNYLFKQLRLIGRSWLSIDDFNYIDQQLRSWPNDYDYLLLIMNFIYFDQWLILWSGYYDRFLSILNFFYFDQWLNVWLYNYHCRLSTSKYTFICNLIMPHQKSFGKKHTNRNGNWKYFMLKKI